MPSIQPDEGDYGAPRLGVSKQIAIEKLDQETKKIAESLKQRGIPTLLADPKLMDEALAAFQPKAPLLSPLHLDLKGRNPNGTKKAPASRNSPDAGPPDPQTLAELLDRALLPTGLKLESLNGRDLQQIAAWQPKPWFRPRATTPGADDGEASARPSRKLSATPSSKKPKLEPLQRLPAREQGPGPAAAAASRNLGEARRASMCSHLPLLPPLVHARVSPLPQKLVA